MDTCYFWYKESEEISTDIFIFPRVAIVLFPQLISYPVSRLQWRHFLSEIFRYPSNYRVAKWHKRKKWTSAGLQYTLKV